MAGSCTKDETDYSSADKKLIEDYLKTNNLTAQSTQSGLYYIIEKPGGALHPKPNSYVVVYYKGYLLDGTVFDEQYSWYSPVLVTDFIQGWEEALPMIGINGKMKLFVPSALGYGSAVKDKIPANSVLAFELELIECY